MPKGEGELHCLMADCEFPEGHVGPCSFDIRKLSKAEREAISRVRQPTASGERTLREPDLVIERMPDWNYGAFLDENAASCIAIGETAQEALNNGMRELLKRASLQSAPSSPPLGPSVTEREIEGWASAKRNVLPAAEKD